MPGINMTFNKPRPLTSDEWEIINSALKKICPEIVAELSKNNNEPIRIDERKKQKLWREKINKKLLAMDVPFRLGRIGPHAKMLFSFVPEWLHLSSKEGMPTAEDIEIYPGHGSDSWMSCKKKMEEIGMGKSCLIFINKATGHLIIQSESRTKTHITAPGLWRFTEIYNKKRASG